MGLGRDGEGGRVDGQGARTVVDAVVAAGQATGHDAVAAGVDGALAGAAVGQCTTQRGWRVRAHKAAVLHAVASSECHAVVELALGLGRDGEGGRVHHYSTAIECTYAISGIRHCATCSYRIGASRDRSCCKLAGR